MQISSKVSIIILYIYSFVLVPSTIYCNNTYECTDRELYDDVIYLRAYKSGIGGGTSMIGKGYCHGSFSCLSMLFIHSGDSDNLHCYGTHSCSNTTIVSNTSSIHCYAQNSCMFSDIRSTGNNRLRCRGYFSCAHAHIHSIETIYAQGSYSLYKAIIDTQNSSNNVDITLSGDYSGYGATIICRQQHQCTIHCNGYTSCYMLFIDCIGVCIIYNTSQYTILPITNFTDFQTLTNHNVFEFETIALRNDEDCNSASMSITADSNMERYNGSDIIITDDNEGPICCRGEQSCFGINRIGYQATAKGNIICSGYDACSLSIITSNNGSVFCEGFDSCYNSQIFNASFMYCMASYSCDNCIITSSHHVLCAASWACAFAKIMSEGSTVNIDFSGHYSGYKAEIYCNVTDLCDIMCTGYRSCFDTTLVCDGNCTVHCNEESECPLGWTASPTNAPSASPIKFTLNTTQYSTLYSSPTPTKYPSNTTNYTSNLNNYLSNSTNYPSKPRSDQSHEPTLYTTFSDTNALTSNIGRDVSNIIRMTVDNTENTEIVEKKHNNKWILAGMIGIFGIVCLLTLFIICFRSGKRSVAMSKQVSKNVIIMREASFDKDAADQMVLRTWLNELVKLPQYYELFVNNGYESIAFIMDIQNKCELDEIGITVIGHQIRIMAEIEKLKETKGTDVVNIKNESNINDEEVVMTTPIQQYDEELDDENENVMGEEGNTLVEGDINEGDIVL